MMNNELLHGTLEMLVLKTLTWEPMHGFGIGRWIEQLGGDSLRIEEGSLYPALYRLERQGLIDSKWRVTENNRRARYYSLTAAGRRHLAREMETWHRLSRAINLVLTASIA